MEEHLTEDTYPTDIGFPLAPYDTLLGQLQRGRGVGFLRARQEDRSAAHAILYECITEDPRIDHQIEDRADYYARLVLLTGMDLISLDQYLKTVPHDRLGWEVTLTLETLGRLAQLGGTAAIEPLKDYVSYGPKWDYALQQLAELPDPSAAEGLPEVICARFKTGEELDASLAYGLFSTDAEYALWKRWSASNPCIERLLKEVEEIEEARARAYPRKEAAYYETLSLEELLSADQRDGLKKATDRVEAKVRPSDVAVLVAAFDQDNPVAWYLGLRGLRRLGRGEHLSHRIFDQVVARVGSWPQERGPNAREGMAIRRTLELLPAEMTLLLARQWLNSPNWRESRLAEHLLEQHATTEDIPIVTAALTPDLSKDLRNADSYRTCSLLDILALFPNIGLVPKVEQVFIETDYSLARRRAAQAMHVNAPEWFAETYAYECLWDCEEETREIGCNGVSTDLPGSIERFQALADDPFESDLVKTSARARLHQL